jgi:hypothetical protein
MGKSKGDRETVLCPVGRFFSELETRAGKDSDFQMHLKRSRLEFLKAVRALVEEKIGHLERQEEKKVKKRVTKIRVE